MIFDHIQYASTYAGLHAGIDKALNAVLSYTPDNYPTGRVELDGTNLFLLVNAYETHAPETALSEAHEQYIDVMYMVEGEETIYVKPTDQLREITKPYNPEIDALLGKLDDDATPVRLTAGSFVVLFPQDAHSPACHTDGPQSVKKVIAKVKIR